MRPSSECKGCLEKLVFQTVNLATNEESLRKEAICAGKNIINFLFEHDVSPANIATIFHRKIKKLTNNSDPFSEFKRREIEQARELFSVIKGEITHDLESLLKFSVKGNALDFFRSDEEILRDFHSNVHFAINHIGILKKRINPETKLLFLADNAGECFFDLPLVKFLADFGMDVSYVIKGYPSQNDITAKDLEFSGLKNAFPKVLGNGSGDVGLSLSAANKTFKKAFYDADIIIAKGMGHYETMGNNADDRLFFLLKAKCPPVAAALEVPCESYILKNARFL